MTVTTTTVGAATTLIIFTQGPSHIVAWNSTNNSQAGTYNITITGQVPMQFDQNWYQNISFLLTLIPTCAFSTETISITVNSTTPNQSYIVGST
jgi:hypothetical protein